MDARFGQVSEIKEDRDTLAKIEGSLPEQVYELQHKTLMKLSDGRFLCFGQDDKGHSIAAILSVSVDSDNLKLEVEQGAYIDMDKEEDEIGFGKKIGVDEKEIGRIIAFGDKWKSEAMGKGPEVIRKEDLTPTQLERLDNEYRVVGNADDRKVLQFKKSQMLEKLRGGVEEDGIADIQENIRQNLGGDYRNNEIYQMTGSGQVYKIYRQPSITHLTNGGHYNEKGEYEVIDSLSPNGEEYVIVKDGKNMLVRFERDQSDSRKENLVVLQENIDLEKEGVLNAEQIKGITELRDKDIIANNLGFFSRDKEMADIGIRGISKLSDDGQRKFASLLHEKGISQDKILYILHHSLGSKPFNDEFLRLENIKRQERQSSATLLKSEKIRDGGFVQWR